jgi:hypothetical protein
MDWNTLILALVLVVSNLISVFLGAKLARHENILPPRQDLQVIEPDEAEDRYGTVWPKDRVIDEEGS